MLNILLLEDDPIICKEIKEFLFAKEYNVQSVKGNISLKDVVRLQSLSLSFRNELLDIQKNNIEQQENLRILTSSVSNIETTINEDLVKQKFLL